VGGSPTRDPPKGQVCCLTGIAEQPLLPPRAQTFSGHFVQKLGAKVIRHPYGQKNFMVGEIIGSGGNLFEGSYHGRFSTTPSLTACAFFTV
jgi:hypothetical protein